MRKSLQSAGGQIATTRNEQPASPVKALRKLFIQEYRDWTAPGSPRTGWKRGELVEVAQSILTGGDWRSEWGDVGYYVAQTWRCLWWLYAAVTPGYIIQSAVEKFERRAKGEQT